MSPPPRRTCRRGRVKKTKQQNLIERLLHHGESALALLHDLCVLFENNLCGKRRPDGETEIGDKRHLPLLTRARSTLHEYGGYISAVRENGRNVFEEIGNAFFWNAVRTGGVVNSYDGFLSSQKWDRNLLSFW